MPITRVALVGHCGFDSGSLARFASEVAPDAQVVRINDQRSLDDAAGPDTLLLVNRVLDGRFDVGGSGIELIKTLVTQPNAGPVMLVSNYDDAQQLSSYPNSYEVSEPVVLRMGCVDGGGRIMVSSRR